MLLGIPGAPLGAGMAVGTHEEQSPGPWGHPGGCWLGSPVPLPPVPGGFEPGSGGGERECLAPGAVGRLRR